MKIYPKTDEKLNGLEALKEDIRKAGGVEIQFFHNNEIWGNYNIIPIIEKTLEEIPEIKEITVHPPLKFYDIEFVISNNINLVKKKIKDAIYLSKKYNVRINLLYHLSWPTIMVKQGLIEKIKKLLKVVRKTNVYILIENITSFNESLEECTVLEICRLINDEHFKACIDICHLHCLANLYKREINEVLEKYLNKELAEKYTYQIHFSATKNNDGLIDKSTHGVKHDSIEEILQDYSILEKYGMEDKNIITEISEKDYNSRVDQISEILLLKEIEEQKNEK